MQRETKISNVFKLELIGTVNPKNTNLKWSEATGKLDLSNRTNLLTSRFGSILIIKSNTLYAGATYTFVLEATNTVGTGNASIGMTSPFRKTLYNLLSQMFP